MGKDYPHNITLEVKSKLAVAGTSLSGFCTGAFNGAGASLYFTGTECTKVVYTSSSSGSTGYPRESYSTANIVRSIISLDCSRSSSVASFRFHIPDQLPSSMYHKDGNGSYCCVSYQLKLQLGREIIEVVPIKIISKPSSPCNPPLPYLEEHVRRRIMLMWCIPQGSIETSIKVDNTRLGNGDVLKICLQLVNNSSVDIEWISASLEEQIDWDSCGHHTSDTTIVASQEFPRSVGMKCKSTTKQTKAKAVHPHNSDDNAIVSTSSEACLQVPDYTLQTCTGNLFEVKHYLSINAKTKQGFTNVMLRIPVQITSPRKSMVR
jgi:hypothetical protein